MPNDINELDVTDAGLKGIFGSRFHDETEKVISKKETPTIPNTAKVEQKSTEKPVTAQWEPVKPNPNWMDKLKACVIWAGGFGGLTLLVFTWQQAGLMDASVALPTMLTCAVLAGWGLGKNVMGGK